jgi:hypothetical protein
LNLTPEQFGLIRPSDFFLMLEAHAKYSNLEWRRHAELTRMQTVWLVNIQLKSDDRLKPSDLWKYEWDNVPSDPSEQMTDEQIREQNQKLMAAMPD